MPPALIVHGLSSCSILPAAIPCSTYLHFSPSGVLLLTPSPPQRIGSSHLHAAPQLGLPPTTPTAGLQPRRRARQAEPPRGGRRRLHRRHRARPVLRQGVSAARACADSDGEARRGAARLRAPGGAGQRKPGMRQARGRLRRLCGGRGGHFFGIFSGRDQDRQAESGAAGLRAMARCAGQVSKGGTDAMQPAKDGPGVPCWTGFRAFGWGVGLGWAAKPEAKGRAV